MSRYESAGKVINSPGTVGSGNAALVQPPLLAITRAGSVGVGTKALASRTRMVSLSVGTGARVTPV